jgi:hypothetical protein
VKSPVKVWVPVVLAIEPTAPATALVVPATERLFAARSRVWLAWTSRLPARARLLKRR